MIARQLVAAMPREAAGIIVFDVLIANPDRHEGNIKVDNPDSPTRIEVFDHDYALWGHTANCGATRLRHVWERLGLSKGLSNTDFHKLAPYLASSEFISEWCNRIYKIPDQFIEDICGEAKELGANANDVQTAIAFLKDRKSRLEDIIKKHKAFFPAVKSWGNI